MKKAEMVGATGFETAPMGARKEVAAMLKAIHAQEDRKSALEKSRDVVSKLREGM